MNKKIFGYPELESAYDLALENAKQLFQDASFLSERCSYSHAFALYQLSREESGKCLLIQHAMLYSALGIKVNYRWLTKMGFVDHVSKTRNSLGLENAFISFLERAKKIDLTKLHEDLEITALNIKQTDNMKNVSLYVGFNGNKFVSPQQVITKDMVNDICLSAEVCINSAKAIRWTEEGLSKMVGYLQNSTDLERNELIGILKSMLHHAFEEKEAAKYCQQMDDVLNSTILVK